MSQFNKIEGSNPLSKKKDKDINEQIDKLTQFYNALEDDTNMSYIIDKLDELHDMQVFIQTQTTLLSEELYAFEKQFDEKIDYSDASLSKIREEAIQSVQKAVISNITEDAKIIKTHLITLENSSIEEIEHLKEQALRRIRHNNRHIMKEKIQKSKVNILGFLILLISGGLLAFSISIISSSVYTNKQIKDILKEQNRHDRALNYLKNESDERFKKVGKLMQQLI